MSLAWIKLTYFQKAFPSLGMMQTLLLGVFTNTIPFLIIYLFWVVFFAVSAYILSANQTTAESFSGISIALGYFFTTFENSIGNISSPTIDFYKPISKRTLVDKLRIYMIYILWWFAQIVLLIILLNFVIALISQYYEDVMNRKIMHTYVMKNNINGEHYVLKKFSVLMGWEKEENIDALILIIPLEQDDDELEWKGHTQTMKKIFVDTNKDLANEMKIEIAKVST